MRAWHGRRSFVLTRPHRSQAGIVLALFEQPPSTLVVTRHTLPLPPPHIISHTHTQCTPSCRCTPCSRLASCPHFWCAVCARTWCEQLTGQAKRRLAEAPSLARTSGPSAVRQPQQPCGPRPLFQLCASRPGCFARSLPKRHPVARRPLAKRHAGGS